MSDTKDREGALSHVFRHIAETQLVPRIRDYQGSADSILQELPQTITPDTIDVARSSTQRVSEQLQAVENELDRLQEFWTLTQGFLVSLKELGIQEPPVEIFSPVSTTPTRSEELVIPVQTDVVAPPIPEGKEERKNDLTEKQYQALRARLRLTGREGDLDLDGAIREIFPEEILSGTAIEKLRSRILSNSRYAGKVIERELERRHVNPDSVLPLTGDQLEKLLDAPHVQTALQEAGQFEFYTGKSLQTIIQETGSKQPIQMIRKKQQGDQVILEETKEPDKLPLRLNSTEQQLLLTIILQQTSTMDKQDRDDLESAREQSAETEGAEKGVSADLKQKLSALYDEERQMEFFNSQPDDIQRALGYLMQQVDEAEKLDDFLHGIRREDKEHNFFPQRQT